MAKTMGIGAAIVTGVSVLVLYGGAAAQTATAKTPTQVDFDLCNSEAQISGMGGSASPATPGTTTMTNPGSVGAGSSASGTIGAGAATGGSTSGGSTLGIASSSSTNPGYQQAYRDCLRRRGF